MDKRKFKALVLSALCLLAGATGGAAWSQTALTDTLRMPTATPDAGVVSHIVREGDTLWDLSRRYLRTPWRWRELQDANGVRDPSNLPLGKVIRLTADTATPASAAPPVVAQPAVALPVMATVAQLTGIAWLKRGVQPQQILTKDSLVQADDILVTGRETFLSLSLRDGSRVTMPSSSAVQVLALSERQTRLRLLNGRIESFVEKQDGRLFEIRTRIANLGVQGTQFRVRDEDGVSSAEVLEGVVQVTLLNDPASAIVLLGGQGTLLSDGAVPVARALLPAPVFTGLDGSSQLAVLPVPGATAYRLRLGRDETMHELVHDAVSEQPSFNLPATVLPSGFYHAQVSALDAAQLEGPGTTIPVFITSTSSGGSAPTTQVVAQRMAELRWPAQAGRVYALELSRRSDFGAILFSHSPVTGSGVVVGPMDGAGTWYWRVRDLYMPDGQDIAYSGQFDIPAN